MTEKNLLIVTRIIGYYCGFTMGVKLYQGWSGAAGASAQYLLAIPLLLIGFTAFYLLRKGKQNWSFAIAAIVIISVMRYFEADLVGMILENGIVQ